MENDLIIEKDIDDPDISNSTIKLDIFQHLKLSSKNKEQNCNCENTIDNIYYCIPCKLSCCEKCTLAEHKKHLLIKKDKYLLKPKQINECFSGIENLLTHDDFFNNLGTTKQNLITEIDNTYNKIIPILDEWKNKKLKEINNLFEEIKQNIENMNKKRVEAKKMLTKFANQHKKFFSQGDNIKDPYNTIFLLNYDLLSIPDLWARYEIKISSNLKNNMKEYKEKEILNNKEYIKQIKNILFLNDNIDPITHEEMNEKFLPLNRMKMDLRDFNADRLKDIDQRINKLSKCINAFEQSVVNSVSKNGNYKDLDKENNAFEHRKVKGAENLFSKRKLDITGKEDDCSLVPNHSIKSKNDVTLDNQILIKNFMHTLTDLYDQYFRMPTIELQSSHADLKLKKSEDEEENVQNFAKVVEGSNTIMLYDKKLKKIVKKTLKLLKNPHGYVKFPFGCRWVIVGDKFYVTGGKDESKQYPNCIIYDTKTEKIKRIMDMQNPRCFHTMIFNEVFETLMVLGGENNNTVEIFDPLSNRWQQLPNLNIPRAIPLFHFDEARGNMYVMFGVEGKFQKPTYTDTIEILDLTEIKQGWMKINYNNKSRMDLKCFLYLYPLNDFLMLIYGGLENRTLKRNGCVFNLVKAEMTKIDKNILDDLRQESKTNKFLSALVMSLSKLSITESN